MRLSFYTGAARTVLTLTAVSILTVPLSSSKAAVMSSHDYRAEAPSADDQGLVVFGDPVVLTDHSRRGAGGWMQFETDPCGTLQRVNERRSLVTQTGFSDDMEDFEDDDPADLGREMIGRWLSEHPQIAVINDGVDKGCDAGWYDEEELPGDFEARLTRPEQPHWPRTAAAGHIA
jgi:hypothetical protein